MQNNKLNPSPYTTPDEALEALSPVIVSELKLKQSPHISFHEVFEELEVENLLKVVIRVTGHRPNEPRERGTESPNSASPEAPLSRQASPSPPPTPVAVIPLAKPEANMPTAIRPFLGRKDGKEDPQEFLEDLEWAYEQDFQNREPAEAAVRATFVNKTHRILFRQNLEDEASSWYGELDSEVRRDWNKLNQLFLTEYTV